MEIQPNRAVAIAISKIIIYVFLLLNMYVIVTKDSLVSKSLAIISSIIFIALLIFLYRSKHMQNKKGQKPN